MYFELATAIVRLALQVAGKSVDEEKPKQATMEEVRTRLAVLTDELEQINQDAETALSAEVEAAAAARREAEDAAALAGLTEAERRATEALVSGAIDDALTRNTKQERGFQIGLAVVGFIGGIIAGVISTLIVQTWL